MKNKKIIIFSHENDIDGLGNIILGKIAFEDVDYVLASNVNILETKFRDYLEKGVLFKYDMIFVTDLALYNPSLEIVSKDLELSKRVLVFDHHKSAINEGCDKYSFTTIIEIDENGRKKRGNGHLAAASVNITKEQKEKRLVLRKTSPRESIKYLAESKYQ